MCYDWDYTEEVVTICFNECGERGIYGQAEDGIIVFIDKFKDPGVCLGERWECRLAYKGTGCSRYYFAWPMNKTEACFGTTEERPTAEEREDTIVAVGNDALFSDAFLPGRYEAYRSPDGSRLQLVFRGDGDIECRESTVRIDGLNRFVGHVPRNLDYSRTEDGYLIKLEE